MFFSFDQRCVCLSAVAKLCDNVSRFVVHIPTTATAYVFSLPVYAWVCVSCAAGVAAVARCISATNHSCDTINPQHKND